jgi:hypothetical protein
VYFYVKKTDKTKSECTSLSNALYSGYHNFSDPYIYFAYTDEGDKFSICYQGPKREQFLDYIKDSFELLYIELEDPAEGKTFKNQNTLEIWQKK